MHGLRYFSSVDVRRIVDTYICKFIDSLIETAKKGKDLFNINLGQ